MLLPLLVLAAGCADPTPPAPPTPHAIVAALADAYRPPPAPAWPTFSHAYEPADCTPLAKLRAPAARGELTDAARACLASQAVRREAEPLAYLLNDTLAKRDAGLWAQLADYALTGDGELDPDLAHRRALSLRTPTAPNNAAIIAWTTRALLVVDGRDGYPPERIDRMHSHLVQALIRDDRRDLAAAATWGWAQWRAETAFGASPCTPPGPDRAWCATPPTTAALTVERPAATR